MSNSWKTFVESCLEGDVFEDEIDLFVDHWHDSDCACGLDEYLGFTAEEYAEWVRNPGSLRAILFAHKHNRPLKEALTLAESSFALAARGDFSGPDDAQAVVDWLDETGRHPS